MQFGRERLADAASTIGIGGPLLLPT